MTEMVEHGFDTSLRLTEQEMAVLDRVNDVVDKAVVAGNPQVIFRHGLALRNAGHIAGLALAKLLSMGRDHWEVFGSDDDFATVAQYEIGISNQTYNKYIDGWENVINHPYLKEDPVLQERIMGKPIQGLLLLRAACREGQMEPQHWEEVANAPNIDSIREIVREIRGTQTSGKTALRIVLEKSGTLKARMGGRYQEVGFIKRDEDAVTQAVIGRLERAGVMVEAVR